MTSPDSDPHAAHGRRNPRFAVEVEAQIRAGEHVQPARTRNVSRGGMCFVAPAPFALGTDLSISMALVFDPETYSEPLSLRARVVWCTLLGASKYQIGTAFVGLTSESRAYLDMFLRYLKDQGGDEDTE